MNLSPIMKNTLDYLPTCRYACPLLDSLLPHELAILGLDWTGKTGL